MSFYLNLTEHFPFFGVIFALILILGVYQLGNYILYINSVNKIFSSISNLRYQKVLIGINFLIIILYPIVLFFSLSKIVLILISQIIFLLGLYKVFSKIHLYKFTKKNFYFYRKKDAEELLIYFVLFCLFILSLSPNTHADSLDYHFLSAKHIIETGNLSTDLTHFHSRLSGAGETLIAIGLIFGSEQFGNLIQFSGLVSLFGIYSKFKKKNNHIFFLLILTTPVILFLTTTAKPQLFNICASTVALALCLFRDKISFSKKEELIKYALILVLLFASYQVKFSFILSTFLIGSLVLYQSICKKYYLEFFFISSILFLLICFPPILWKTFHFNGLFIQYLYSPLPMHLPGMQEFKQYLISVGHNENFYNLIFPHNLKQFTNSLGIGAFFIFLVNYKKNSDAKFIIIISILFIVISFLLGQQTARFFLEPFYWIMMSCIYFGLVKNYTFFNFLCRLQILLIIPIIIYGIIFLSPGSLTKNLRDKVLKNNANGYSLFQWSNELINEDETVLSGHRSISLGKSKTISMDFITFRGAQNAKKENMNLYVNELIKYNPKYYLEYGTSEQINKTIKKCVGLLLHEKKKVGIHAARNPLNRSYTYNGYIYEFKSELLPDCISVIND